jgi:hypothetical protein
VTPLTRRDFHGSLLASLTAYGLIELLWTRDLFADAVKPVIGQWFHDLNSLCKDVKARQIKDIDFQAKLEELYRKVNLADMLAFLDLDKVASTTKLPDNGAANLGVDLSKIEGLSKGLVFGKQIFAMKKGRAVVPHGHDNMCTGFLVLRGNFIGRHYDRVEDNKDHYLIRPTIDRTFKPGECSTISDHKDNVHWFTADSDTGFLFNIHVIGYNPDNKNVGSRVYVDPMGERTGAGLIVAKKMSSADCHKKYG